LTNNVKEKVTAAINTTGYPVELFVSSILNSHNHITWANQYFLDYETNQSRTVDIRVPAFFTMTGESNIRFATELVIECKKSPKTAWVFFEYDDITQIDYLGQIFDYEQICKNDFIKNNLLLKFDINLPSHYGIKSKLARIARNYQVVKIGEDDLDDHTKNNKTKDTIFEAINQVTKFTTYTIQTSVENVVKRFKEDKVYPFFFIHYPIIVYDGPLYNGYLKDDKIELEERDHIIVKHQFRPQYAQREKIFLIDVIKKEYFEKLMLELEKESEQIALHLQKNKKEFVKYAESLKI
jgi:hypothetical protein